MKTTLSGIRGFPLTDHVSTICMVAVLTCLCLVMSGCGAPKGSMILSDGQKIEVDVSENRYAEHKENVAEETRELKLGDDEDETEPTAASDERPVISVLGNLEPDRPVSEPVDPVDRNFTVSLYSFGVEQVLTDVQKNNIYTAAVNAVTINTNLFIGESFTEEQLSAFRTMDLSAEIVLPDNTFLHVAAVDQDLQVISLRLYESAARTVVTTSSGSYDLLMTQMELNEMAKVMGRKELQEY